MANNFTPVQTKDLFAEHKERLERVMLEAVS